MATLYLILVGLLGFSAGIAVGLIIPRRRRSIDWLSYRARLQRAAASDDANYLQRELGANQLTQAELARIAETHVPIERWREASDDLIAAEDVVERDRDDRR